MTTKTDLPVRTADEYLDLPYHITVVPNLPGEGPGYTASVQELPGCVTVGDDWADLGAMLRDAMRAWIETALEDGQRIPEPVVDEVPAKFLLRLPLSLHRDLTLAAQADGVSMNQYIVAQLARAVGKREAGAEPAG
jgi:antitoxin HicB